MARRPDILSDRDDWGAVLNDYLDVSLDEDGTIRGEAVAPVVGPLVADALADDDTPAQAAALAAEAAVEAEVANRDLADAADLAALNDATRARITASELSPLDYADDVTVTSIQAAVDACAADGGGTVRLPHGSQVDIDGTIRLKTNVTLDLNGSTLTAADNADFTDIDLGLDSVRAGDVDYNPASIKPVIAMIGTSDEDRLASAAVINGTIDGNGANQPDDGSYANVAVFWADDCRVDVTSVNARPGLTINPVDGPNTGNRAFCLFVGNARRTQVSGRYNDSGYDAIGLRQGAVDTIIRNVYAGKALKGSVQVATGALRTRIIDSVLDNTEGTNSASHALFCHSAKGLTVMGTALLNGGDSGGSPFHAFGDTVWGITEDVALTNCVLTQTRNVPLFAVTTEHVERVTATDITFTKTEASNAVYIPDGAKRITLVRWRGRHDSASTAIYVKDASDVELIDCDFDTAITANPTISLQSTTRVKVRGGSYLALGGASILCGTTNACAGVVIEGARLVASDSVQAIGDNTDIDVIGCDLSGVSNANKLRIYGPLSGVVWRNRGVVTEANGIATVPAASTSVTISHGLWRGTGTTSTPRTDRLWLPRDFQASFASDPGSASRVWVSSVTSTEVTFTVDAAPGEDVDVAWSARMDRSV